MSRRHRALDELDGDHWQDEGHSPYESGNWGASARVAAKRSPELKTIGSWDCWCGLPREHNWPGKNEGRPHPC